MKWNMSFKCIIVPIKKNTWNIMSDAYWAHTLQTNVLQLTKFQNLSLKKLGKFFSKYVRIGAQFASSMIKWSAISYDPSKFQHFNGKYLMNILSQMLFAFNGLNVVFFHTLHWMSDYYHFSCHFHLYRCAAIAQLFPFIIYCYTLIL